MERRRFGEESPNQKDGGRGRGGEDLEMPAGARKGSSEASGGSTTAALARAFLPLTLLLALGFSLAAYNFLALVICDRNAIGSGSATVSASRPVVLADLGGGGGRRERPGSVGRRFHVAMSATGQVYSRWQSRIMYYWYKRVRGMPGSAIGGFTRILHSGRPDSLMAEIPTVVVDPLPGGDRGYIVLNRPWAFVQWLEKTTIEEDYILMAEPDHIFVRPPPNLAIGRHPVGFPFLYINATENEKVIRKFYPEEKGPVTNIDPVGNSPVIIHKALLKRIAPTWMDLSLRMKDDPEADKALGWILEM